MLYDRRWELDEIGRVLWAAADYIEEHGWTQCTLFNPDGRVCAVGAIDRSGADKHQGNQAVITLALSLSGRLYTKTYDASAVITLWNDTPGRTKAEVLAGLREAAKIK